MSNKLELYRLNSLYENQNDIKTECHLNLDICIVIYTQLVRNLLEGHEEQKLAYNRPIQAKCVSSVTNCGLRLDTAMAPTINM